MLQFRGLQDALYTTLVVLVANMHEDRIEHLFEGLQKAVDGDSDWGGHLDVLEFLRCLVIDNGDLVIAQ